MDEENNLSSMELNQESLDSTIQEHQNYQEADKAQQAFTEAVQAEATAQEEEDPANDLGDYIRDTAVGVVGGLQDTASSLITAPERVIDAFTGEIAE